MLGSFFIRENLANPALGNEVGGKGGGGKEGGTTAAIPDSLEWLPSLSLSLSSSLLDRDPSSQSPRKKVAVPPSPPHSSSHSIAERRRRRRCFLPSGAGGGGGTTKSSSSSPSYHLTHSQKAKAEGKDGKMRESLLF